MTKPNILLITSDQQHFSMLGKVNEILKTPNLDKLADEGMSFDRAYCPNPTCSPSRASILTGMYPSEHGCWSLGTKLPESTPTMAQYLADNGYETALIGKAHFQPTKGTKEFPSIETPEFMWDIDFWRNFDKDFYGFKHIELLRNHTAEHWVGQHYVAWLEDNGCKNWRKYFFKPRGKMLEKQMGKWKIPEKYHYNNWIAERTTALMREYKENDKPFFLWASFPDPHYPQLVPSPWDKMYKAEDMEIPDFSFAEHEKNPPYFKEVFKKVPKLAEYKESGQGVHGLHRHIFNKKKQQKKLAYAYGMVSFMDKYIGKILEQVKQLGLEDNTIIVFTCDHGDLFGQHGFVHKCIFHYEDLLRVPMIVKYKNVIPEGQRSDSLQSLIDIAPTLMDLCNLNIPQPMSGVNQSEVWKDAKKNKRDYIICENRHEPHVMHIVSYVEERYKINVYEGRNYGELYDLPQDKGEHNNLWDDDKYRQIKIDMLFRYLCAEMAKDKTDKMDAKIKNYQITIDSKTKTAKLLCENGNDLWNDSSYTNEKIEILLAIISERIGSRKMWMPRIAGA